MRLFVNGSQVAVGASPHAIIDGPAAFVVGSKSTGGGAWSGTIDEPAVYQGTVLTSAKVSSHYVAGG
jgi:hypothetical protein